MSRSSPGKLRITWVKSSIGYSRRQKGTIRALGFRRLGDVVEQADTPVIRGMVDKVSHLVQSGRGSRASRAWSAGVSWE